MSNIDFRTIRSLNKSQNYGFEEFCCHLARNHEVDTGSKFSRFRGADGGVECVWTLPDGSQIGWQAKYFFKLDKKQLQKSITAAIQNFPNLTKYYICLPFNLTRNEDERFTKYVKEWKKLATQNNMKLEIILWDKTKLIEELLKVENYEFRLKFWFDANILSEKWFKDHLEDVIAIAGPRYVPALNIDVPITKVYEAFGLTDIWFNVLTLELQKIDELISTWSRYIKETGSDSSIPEFPKQVKKDGKRLKMHLSKITNLLVKILEEGIESIAIEKDLLAKSLKVADLCITKLKDDIEKKYGQGSADDASFKQWHREYQLSFPTAHYDHSVTIYNKLEDFKTIFHYLTISTSSTLMISGTAGSGKTHSICDMSHNRFQSEMYSVVLFGSQFSNQDPWDQVKSLLGFSSTISRDEMLSMFDLVGEINNSKVIFFIDALNETENRSYWKTNLPKMISQINRFPNLKLCFSCRTEYIPDTLPENIDTTNFEHTGFQGIEYEAVFEFFNFYGIKTPNIPLLSSEFSNPLFLKIICESLVNNGYNSFPSSYFGISQIIEEYIKGKESKIADKLNYNILEQHVNNAVNEIIDRMKETDSSLLEWNEVKSICDKEWLELQKRNSLFDQLLKEGIMKETRRITENQNVENCVEFGYEKILSICLPNHTLRM